MIRKCFYANKGKLKPSTGQKKKKNTHSQSWLICTERKFRMCESVAKKALTNADTSLTF